MYDGMAKTSHWAALYFIALMTIGNYVLFNLLVAILVEGFSSVVSLTTGIFLQPLITLLFCILFSEGAFILGWFSYIYVVVTYFVHALSLL